MSKLVFLNHGLADSEGPGLHKGVNHDVSSSFRITVHDDETKLLRMELP